MTVPAAHWDPFGRAIQAQRHRVQPPRNAIRFPAWATPALVLLALAGTVWLIGAGVFGLGGVLWPAVLLAAGIGGVLLADILGKGRQSRLYRYFQAAEALGWSLRLAPAHVPGAPGLSGNRRARNPGPRSDLGRAPGFMGQALARAEASQREAGTISDTEARELQAVYRAIPELFRPRPGQPIAMTIEAEFWGETRTGVPFWLAVREAEMDTTLAARDLKSDAHGNAGDQGALLMMVAAYGLDRDTGKDGRGEDRFRARIAQIMRRLMPERVRDALDSLIDSFRAPGDPVLPVGPEREAARQEVVHDVETVAQEAGMEPEELLHRMRKEQALIRHARVVDAIFMAQDQGRTETPEQVQDLHEARAALNELRPHGSRDAEAIYKHNPELATDVASGDPDRRLPVKRAMRQAAELRQNPELRADRFVERWRKLERASEHKYAAGDYAGHRAARREMGDMAMSLERDPQMESLLRGRKRELGIDFDSGRSLGRELAFSHGIDFGRGRGIGL